MDYYDCYVSTDNNVCADCSATDCPYNPRG